MSRKILITGSTGYLAKYVIDELLATTDDKIIVSYRNEKGDYKQNDRLIFEEANLLNPESFEPLFIKYLPDTVIHLAALARVREGEEKPVEAFKTNFAGTMVLLDLSEKYGVKTFLSASSNLAQGAVSNVGIAKLLIEQSILKSEFPGMNIVLYRVPNILDSKGAVTHIFRKLINENKSITITDPRMSRSFISGPDAAKEVIYLLNNGEHKGIYVSYKKPKPIIDLAKEMMESMDKDLPIEIIGIKPGEKLSEHVFNESDITKTDLPYLGKLKEYNFNPTLTVNAINKLNTNTEIAKNSKIQELLNSLI